MAARERLNTRKEELADCEALVETKHTLEQLSLEGLGKGAKMKRRVDVAKKRCWEVLDRLARHGQGLSDGKRNDFERF